MQSTGQTDAHELHDVQLSLLITFRYRVSFFRSAFRVRKYSVIEMVMIGVLWINVHKKHGLRQSLPAKHREIRLRQRAPVRRADRIPIDPTANHLGWPLRSTKIALWPSDFLWLRRICRDSCMFLLLTRSSGVNSSIRANAGRYSMSSGKFLVLHYHFNHAP